MTPGSFLILVWVSLVRAGSVRAGPVCPMPGSGSACSQVSSAFESFSLSCDADAVRAAPGTVPTRWRGSGL